MLLNLLGEAPMQTQAIAQNVERRQWVEQELCRIKALLKIAK